MTGWALWRLGLRFDCFALQSRGLQCCRVLFTPCSCCCGASQEGNEVGLQAETAGVEPLQSTGAQSKESEEQGQLQQQSLHENTNTWCRAVQDWQQQLHSQLAHLSKLTSLACLSAFDELVTKGQIRGASKKPDGNSPPPQTPAHTNLGRQSGPELHQKLTSKAEYQT